MVAGRLRSGVDYGDESSFEGGRRGMTPVWAELGHFRPNTQQKEFMNRSTSKVEIYIVGESNGQNNPDDVVQPGSREWREAGFTYIVIVDTSTSRDGVTPVVPTQLALAVGQPSGGAGASADDSDGGVQ
jgi:hypothetical protein